LILQRLTAAGIIDAVDVNALMLEHKVDIENPIEFITEEFLKEERVYTRQLEELVDVKKDIQRSEFLARDECDSVFGSLNLLLDFQIAFLVGLEMNMMRAPKDRRWAALFTRLADSCPKFATFISAEDSSKRLLRFRLEQRKQYDGDRVSTLLATCLRLIPAPSQRLPKYQVFLQVFHYLNTYLYLGMMIKII
jgi:hypothetical protein